VDLELRVNEISSLLTTRYPLSGNHHEQNSSDVPVHRDWDITSKAALVILWGLLIYPRLDPEMRLQPPPVVSVNQLHASFREHLGSEQQWRSMLERFVQHDYIRIQAPDRVTPGTRLFASVDAAKMYDLFRTSVLVRQLHTTTKSPRNKNS
jgi:hypothetical protein